MPLPASPLSKAPSRPLTRACSEHSLPSFQRFSYAAQTAAARTAPVDTGEYKLWAHHTVDWIALRRGWRKPRE